VIVSGNRSVAVLGPIPRDRIVTHRGEVLEKYGCALYTVAALAALLDPDDRIYPIVHVRREDEEPIKALLSAFPNVDLTGIRSASDHGAVVELIYTDQANRIEQQIGFMDPITPADVEFALHADAFVCVPITDYEVGQATLTYIKQHSDGTILLDAHGPTSTLVIGGERRRRLWVERDSWLPHVDILKMNLEEAGCSWFPSEIELEHHHAGNPIPEEQLPDFAEHCLRHGVQAVCVTLDQRGCVAYHLDESGGLVEEEIPRIVVDDVVDATGAGDSFAAGMAFGFLQDHDIVSAARYGNAMGAQRVSGSGLDVYRPLAETNKQIARTYGAPVRA
jgi:sugar/nucleoside kinase (ribokinase family)